MKKVAQTGLKEITTSSRKFKMSRPFDEDNPGAIDLDYFSITPTDLLAEESDRDRLQGGHTLNDNTSLGRQQKNILGINQKPRKDNK